MSLRVAKTIIPMRGDCVSLRKPLALSDRHFGQFGLTWIGSTCSRAWFGTRRRFDLGFGGLAVHSGGRELACFLV